MVSELVEKMRSDEQYLSRDFHGPVARAIGFRIGLAADRIEALEAERDEARALCEEFLDGRRAVLPHSKKHAEDLYTVAVACLKNYGIDAEAGRQP
jgi:hypothetical protein